MRKSLPFMITGLGLLVIGTFSASSQTKTTSAPDTTKKVTGVAMSQTQPEFPGGADSLKMFLTRNMKYPEASRQARKQGHVFVGFKVDRTGAIKDPYILSSVSEDIDAEALRLVGIMPTWTAGTISGKPVDKNYVLEIAFVIPGSRK
jgi:protein TonB